MSLPDPQRDARTIGLAPPSRFTTRFLYAVATAFTGFLVYIHVGQAQKIATERAGAQLFGLLSVFVVMALLVASMLWAIRRSSLTLTGTVLIFRAGFYGRTIQRDRLRIASAFEGSLYDNGKVAPRWRTNGIRMPGYQAGWFRLVNGEKALVLLTDPFHVTYLPTADGYSLLVSTTELLPALRDSTMERG